jgi:hypothetical protein
MMAHREPACRRRIERTTLRKRFKFFVKGVNQGFKLFVAHSVEPARDSLAYQAQLPFRVIIEDRTMKVSVSLTLRLFFLILTL